MNQIETTWNLEALKPDNFENELQLIKISADSLAKKWKKNKKYLKDSNVLLEALSDFEAYGSIWGGGGRLAYYCWLKLSLDQSNPENRAQNNLVEQVLIENANKLRFFDHQLMKLPLKQQRVFLDSKNLSHYHYYLQKLFSLAKYELSEKEENILALKDKTARDNWETLTASLLSKEKVGGKTFEELLTALKDQDKVKRDAAAVDFNGVLEKYSDVAEMELNSILADKKVDDTLRKISRPDTVRHLSDDIETEVVDRMLDSVTARNTIAHDYYRLKADLLGLPKLAYHERSVTYGSIDREYSFKDGVAVVASTFSKLDSHFWEIASHFIEHGQIDVYPKVGKHGGAFCAHLNISLPTYILLNWTNSFRDVTTLAHELGHGINNEIMRQKQSSIYWRSPMSTAEVASTFFEDFTVDTLAEGVDDETKLSIIMARLDDSVATIWRQVACYRFEQSIHSKIATEGYLSKDRIGKLFQESMSSYMGEAVEQSPGSENWWIYWSHIRNYFYVYSYASGLLISKAMQNAVRKDHGFIEKVNYFLGAGASESPKTLFKIMGIDITSEDFWNQGMDEVAAMITEAKKLAYKLGKIKKAI